MQYVVTLVAFAVCGHPAQVQHLLGSLAPPLQVGFSARLPVLLFTSLSADSLVGAAKRSTISWHRDPQTVFWGATASHLASPLFLFFYGPKDKSSPYTKTLLHLTPDILFPDCAPRFTTHSFPSWENSERPAAQYRQTLLETDGSSRNNVWSLDGA